MTVNRKIATLALAAGIGALNVVTLASAAQADERGRGRPHFAESRRDFGRGERGEHRHGGNVGAGVAIGIGALVLGSIIAAEANRRHADRDYDYDQD